MLFHSVFSHISMQSLYFPSVIQCRVLLNLRTSQPFEEVVEDLGQVLKMTAAKRMYAVGGQEIRSFSQLRNEFADVDTFYLSAGGGGTGAPGSPLRRSRSRAGLAAAAGGASGDDPARTTAKQRARSKSRPRILYAPDSEVVRAAPGECELLIFWIRFSRGLKYFMISYL